VPRKGYDEAIKSAFLEAVTAARAAGQPWVETFKAAKEAGYTGTLGGIEKMFHVTKGKKAVRKPGRPRKEGLAVARKPNRLYSEATRVAIVNAALEARKAGKKWRQALEAAQAAGYRGRLTSLIGLIRYAEKTARKPGRPARQRASGLEPIQEIIERLAKERVRVALDRAIEELEKVRG